MDDFVQRVAAAAAAYRDAGPRVPVKREACVEQLRAIIDQLSPRMDAATLAPITAVLNALEALDDGAIHPLLERRQRRKGRPADGGAKVRAKAMLFLAVTRQGTPKPDAASWVARNFKGPWPWGLRGPEPGARARQLEREHHKLFVRGDCVEGDAPDDVEELPTMSMDNWPFEDAARPSRRHRQISDPENSVARWYSVYTDFWSKATPRQLVNEAERIMTDQK